MFKVYIALRKTKTLEQFVSIQLWLKQPFINLLKKRNSSMTPQLLSKSGQPSAIQSICRG